MSAPVSQAQLTRAPYFPLYAKDWLVATATLTPEQKGALIDLLAHAWYGDPPCTLPDDDEVLAKLSQLGSKRWARNAPAVRARFERADGRLRSAELAVRYDEMTTLSERRSAAGRKASDARWNRGNEPPREAHSGRARSVAMRSDGRGTDAAVRSGCQSESQAETDQKTTEPPTSARDGVASCQEDGNWLATVERAWQEAYGGPLDRAKAAKCLPGVIAGYGIKEVCRRLKVYANTVEARYASLDKFAGTIGKYDHEPVRPYDRRALHLAARDEDDVYVERF